MIKNIIAIYPGRFQPFGQHHAAAFKWLQKEFGAANAYIVTSNVVQPPKSPFSFKDKQDIIRQYGFDDRLVQVKNPYKSEEILKQLNPNDTAVVFMVGAKDMAEDPRFKIGKKASGGDSYFQDYKKNKSNLKGFDKHGYLIVAPHVEINIPGYGEMSGTTLRKVLGAKKPRAQKAEQFKAIFGWYNKKTADMVFDKLEGIKESTLFSKQWWGESLDLTEAISMDELKSKFKKFIDNIKQEGRETKEAFSLLGKAAMGKIELTDAQKTQIGEQMKDVLKTIGLSALAIAPGGLIAGLLIKVMKAEKYITPSAFMKEAVLKPNAWKDFKLTTLSEDDMKVIWDMYTSTYAKQGMDFSADNFTELQSKYKAVYLEDVDGDSIADAFIVYKSTPYGNKISLLGTNDKKEAKKELISKLFNLLKTRSWYIEASMKMEEILSKRSDIDAVTDETVIKGVAGDKSLEMMEDGYYKRKLSKVDKSIVKRIYGKPTVTSIKEDKKDKSDPCWSGYRQYGMKKKGSKEVPNCVPESVSEGSMSTEQQKTHNTKIDKLKSFLDSNIGREFEYDFDVFSKTVFGVKMPTQESLLKEGGAGGHMHHPFDIEWVDTGKDLLTVFQQSVNYLKKGPASVKIDGVNASIRLITLDGKKVFVMDRGSNKPLDVKGITKAELIDRFGAGHGMIKVGGKVLDIFNDSIPACTPALKRLGLWDNPNILFNIEYVAGSTNVLAYDKNFLAVHGLLEIEQVTPTKRATKEKPTNKAAMQDMLNNLAPVANKNGYDVLGSIPTTLDGNPDLKSALNQKYTVVRSAAEKETKTLSQWLAKAKVKPVSIKTVDGKTISSLSKEVLIKISDGIPLKDFIADPVNYQAAIDGFVIYLATMKLGDAVLDKLNSPLGPVNQHEGIVIRDKSISKDPFKITGRFIIRGLASQFKK
jgi:hypothetical protein